MYRLAYTRSRKHFLSEARVWRWCVFPLGQAYHLPHHLFPDVPHYRLRQLHEQLMEDSDYAANLKRVAELVQ